MRKLIITAVAGVVLAGLAGCADNSVKPGSSESAGPSSAAGTTTTTSAADQTKAVCTEAISTNATATSAIQAKATEAAAAMSSNDLAKMSSIAADLQKLGSDWSSKLTELSKKDIDADVKSALIDGATTITSVSSSSNLNAGSAAQIQSQLTVLNAKIAAACA
jgi:hypothetical protein